MSSQQVMDAHVGVKTRRANTRRVQAPVAFTAKGVRLVEGDPALHAWAERLEKDLRRASSHNEEIITS